jgi:hypothetical protein
MNDRMSIVGVIIVTIILVTAVDRVKIIENGIQDNSSAIKNCVF